MAETIQDRIVTTRKKHYCLACLRDFPAGTKMRYWFGRVMGDINSCYTCPTCDEILLLRREGEYEEGHIWELCNDLRFETPEAYLAELQKASGRSR